VQSTRGDAAGSTRAGLFRELKTSSRVVRGTDSLEVPPPVLVSAAAFFFHPQGAFSRCAVFFVSKCSSHCVVFISWA
jgi:hypothetical protein